MRSRDMRKHSQNKKQKREKGVGFSLQIFHRQKDKSKYQDIRKRIVFGISAEKLDTPHRSDEEKQEKLLPFIFTQKIDQKEDQEDKDYSVKAAHQLIQSLGINIQKRIQ